MSELTTHKDAGKTVCQWKGYEIRVSLDATSHMGYVAQYDVFAADGTLAGANYFEISTAKAICTRLAKANKSKWDYIPTA